MADNVLSALFQDQADAIREGLGDIGKIKPAGFPAKTREIVALIGAGGSGDGSIGEWVSAEGSFTAEATSETIEHNLGVVPDIFGVFMSTMGPISNLVTEKYCLIAAYGLSEKLKTESNVEKCGGSFALSQGALFAGTATTGLEDTDGSMGRLNSATATTVKVGAEGVGELRVGSYYAWFAIGRKA
jgi:hypothetical protein